MNGIVNATQERIREPGPLHSPSPGPHTVSKPARSPWVIADADGVVRANANDKDRADEIREKLDRWSRYKKRSCIRVNGEGDRCGAVFMSEGPHNRMCPNCRGKDGA